MFIFAESRSDRGMRERRTPLRSEQEDDFPAPLILPGPNTAHRVPLAVGRFAGELTLEGRVALRTLRLFHHRRVMAQPQTSSGKGLLWAQIQPRGSKAVSRGVVGSARAEPL